MYTGPNSSTTGLVLALDAANPKSYVSGSAVWNDLSGNSLNVVTGSNVEKPQYSSLGGGSVYFKPVTGSGTAEAPTMIRSGDPRLYLIASFTLDAWFKPESPYSGSGTGTILRAGGGFDIMYSMFYNSNNTIRYEYFSASLFQGTTTPVLNISNSTFNNVSIVKNSSIVTIYFNGISVHSATLTDTTNTSFFSLCIGNNSANTGQKFNGNIASVRIYNRALSAQEVANNYNAVKSRFGL